MLRLIYLFDHLIEKNEKLSISSLHLATLQSRTTLAHS